MLTKIQVIISLTRPFYFLISAYEIRRTTRNHFRALTSFHIHQTYLSSYYIPDDANIILTGNNIAEVDVQLRDLCKSLLKWVHSNGLCLNLNKTNYMIFSCSRKLELPRPLLTSYLLIKQKSGQDFSV